MLHFFTILAWVAVCGAAIPTWPSSTDQLEDLMFLNAGYRASGFANAVTPCGFSAAGPGRNTAAEWIRTAFHDMITGDTSSGGSGGLDASIMFETDRPENTGAAFSSSLAFFANHFSTRASISDLIALSVYTAVRSCGGPVVPIRAGRIDATVAGPKGFVPAPGDSTETFENQFARTGFSTSDMIAMTACGHTLGGVHAEDSPHIVPMDSAPNNFVAMDSTSAVFDNRVAVEWVAGNTTDPLSVGLSVAAGSNSDAKVFGADGNTTMQALTNPATFATTCSSILQRMIEVVPPQVTFTPFIVPYEVKPTVLQLTLLSGGTSLSFTGLIRVRTTVRPASNIASVQLIYKDRSGGNACGACTISTSVAGTASGFDESFAFYSFSSVIPSDTSISSFNVLIGLVSGGSELQDNSGTSFPIQDSIMLQSPQSCLSQGNLTIVAAVRNTRNSLSVSLDLSLMVPRQDVIVPSLQITSLAMVKGATVGSYSLYSVSYIIASGQASTTKFDVTSGDPSSTDNFADVFKSMADLGSTCAMFSLGEGSSSSLSSTIFTSTTSSSTPATPSQNIHALKFNVANYTYFGCQTESTNMRALSSFSKVCGTMTLEACATFCDGYIYWGVEYGRECYCGNSFNAGSTVAPATDCSMLCAGNNLEYCGAGNRLTVYRLNTTIASPAPTPSIKPTVGPYKYYGCQTEAANMRALSSTSTASDSMTLELCESFCSGYTYWGIEYGRECYCGNSFNAGSVNASDSDCTFLCPGNKLEYCGAANRLSCYSL